MFQFKTDDWFRQQITDRLFQPRLVAAVISAVTSFLLFTEWSTGTLSFWSAAVAGMGHVNMSPPTKAAKSTMPVDRMNSTTETLSVCLIFSPLLRCRKSDHRLLHNDHQLWNKSSLTSLISTAMRTSDGSYTNTADLHVFYSNENTTLPLWQVPRAASEIHETHNHDSQVWCMHVSQNTIWCLVQGLSWAFQTFSSQWLKYFIKFKSLCHSFSHLVQVKHKAAITRPVSLCILLFVVALDVYFSYWFKRSIFIYG